MEKEIEKNRVVYIPGYIDRMEYHGLSPTLDIWGTAVDCEKKIDADFVVGHSLGASFALRNWQKSRNIKLILVNPLLIKRNIFDWVWRNIKYPFAEKFNFDRRRIVFLWHLPHVFKTAIKLLSVDTVKIFDQIPRGNIIVIRGAKDEHFCDQEVADFMKSKNIEFVEIPEAGHEWHELFSSEVERVISAK